MDDHGRRFILQAFMEAIEKLRPPHLDGARDRQAMKVGKGPAIEEEHPLPPRLSERKLLRCYRRSVAAFRDKFTERLAGNIDPGEELKPRFMPTDDTFFDKMEIVIAK